MDLKLKIYCCELPEIGSNSKNNHNYKFNRGKMVSFMASLFYICRNETLLKLE